MQKKIFVTLMSIAVLSSCASRPKDIDAAYVSPTLYNNLSCAQLQEEAQSVSNRAIAASGIQDKKASNDAVAMTVGVVVFWPALFLTKGDGSAAADVSRLKGEMNAIEEASTRKRCGIKFERPGDKKKS